MVGKLFDDLFHVIRQGLETDVVDTIESVELDLELPRGYVAKIKRVECFVKDYDDLYDTLIVDDYLEFRSCLLRDPDDAVTLAMPDNSVQHDVICEFSCDMYHDTTGGTDAGENHWVWDFGDDKGLDVITARNLRVNGLVGAPNSPTNAPFIVWVVYYSLEKIKDNEILELLDIL